jgi:hypothetical protein
MSKSIQLHRTYQPEIFYVAFDKLPIAAQAMLRDAEPEVECSSYTVGRHSAFIRAVVEVNGEEFDAEISIGDCIDEDMYDEDGVLRDGDGNELDEDEEAESTARELAAITEIENTTVYLTARR